MAKKKNKFFTDDCYEVPSDGQMETIRQSLDGKVYTIRVPKVGYRPMLNNAGMVCRPSLTTGAALQDLNSSAARMALERLVESGFLLADECPAKSLPKSQIVEVMGSEDQADPCSDEDCALLGEFQGPNGITVVRLCPHLKKFREIRKRSNYAKMQIDEAQLKSLEGLLLSQAKEDLVKEAKDKARRRALKMSEESSSQDDSSSRKPSKKTSK